MEGLGAMKKYGLYAAMIAAFAWLVLFLFPVGTLYFTEAKVMEAAFLDVYYAQVGEGETEFDVFKEYMVEQGWVEVQRMGSGQEFERDGETFFVHSTDIKTIFRNGWLNF
ncbi:hypothetical protein JSY36_04930 [Bacillus sp. H-16]|uniref:hypothetical protein n=1 Tax=Alteribacter salitolerans TaxID=2912333 RepID=UPI001966340A|nr:hypothetical protein [Alteribacter salitolerans]MBM7095096.1 hypothetical protein [Alteribacter salitolerans]